MSGTRAIFMAKDPYIIAYLNIATLFKVKTP